MNTQERENLEEITEKKKYSRKEMLQVAGKSIAGVAMVGAIPTILAGCGGDEGKDADADGDKPVADVEIPSKEVLEYDYIEKSEDMAAHPFPYQKLDPATVMERTHASFFNKGGCCSAVADGIIGELGDKAGYPWNQVPIGAFPNGAAGYGSGSLCGSLGGAAMAIGLVCETEQAREITGELFSWYKDADLPIYMPTTEIDTVVPGSVNCVDSVGEYLELTGLSMGDDLRLERCACLSADVAGKTVELLNKHFNV